MFYYDAILALPGYMVRVITVIRCPLLCSAGQQKTCYYYNSRSEEGTKALLRTARVRAGVLIRIAVGSGLASILTRWS